MKYTHKLTLEEVLERLGDDRIVEKSRVYERDLNRKVWVAEWHMPGCLSEARSICLNKASAIEAALTFADGENGPPRGMKTDLMRHHRSDTRSFLGTAITTIEQHTLSDLLL